MRLFSTLPYVRPRTTNDLRLERRGNLRQIVDGLPADSTLSICRTALSVPGRLNISSSQSLIITI
jgi:hypothetical protein